MFSALVPLTFIVTASSAHSYKGSAKPLCMTTVENVTVEPQRWDWGPSGKVIKRAEIRLVGREKDPELRIYDVSETGALRLIYREQVRNLISHHTPKYGGAVTNLYHIYSGKWSPNGKNFQFEKNISINTDTRSGQAPNTHH